MTSSQFQEGRFGRSEGSSSMSLSPPPPSPPNGNGNSNFTADDASRQSSQESRPSSPVRSQTFPAADPTSPDTSEIYADAGIIAPDQPVPDIVTFVIGDEAAQSPSPRPSPSLSPPAPMPLSIPAMRDYNHWLALTLGENSHSFNALQTVAPGHVSTLDLPDPNGNDAWPAGIDAGPQRSMRSEFESFARIEFADSTFQMTTYAVVIGRDQRALDQARQQERRLQEYERRKQDSEALGLDPPSPPLPNRGRYSKSYVSEEGGMLGPESSDDEDNIRPAKRRKMTLGDYAPKAKEQETRLDYQIQSAPTDLILQRDLISDRQYVSLTAGAAAVNLPKLKPSPYHVPFVAIHSPSPGTKNTKAISRKHLKIEFNNKKGVFEAVGLHENGFFHDDVWHRTTTEGVTLRSGDRLQIKDVEFRFFINGVEEGKTGGEDYGEDASSKRYSEGGKEMSFEFESSHGGEQRDTSDEASDVEKEVFADVAVEISSDEEEAQEQQEEEEEEEGNNGQRESQEVMETVESDPVEQVKPEYGSVGSGSEQPSQLLAMVPTKKRGPGRPPKNGIMSKREERLLKKQALEEAKKQQPPDVPGEPPVKRKVGRPRKHPRPEDEPENKPEKRKYKPRKPKNEDGEEDPEGEKVVKEKRREKPKTPPLELKKEDFTEEQLQKPNKNYGLLIDEVLTAEPDGLTLKQIYKRIQKTYPYYYFVVDTKGWESSVRHNLIGNDAFQKNEETHLWRRIPGIELDAGKKRKISDVSPDRPLTSLYGYSQHYQHVGHAPQHQNHHMAGQAHGYHAPGNLPPRYPPNGQAYAGQQSSAPYPPQPSTTVSQQPQGRPAYAHPHPQSSTASGHGHGTVQMPRPQLTGQQQNSYGSSYNGRPQQYTPLANASTAPGAAAQHPSHLASAARPGPGHHPTSQHGLPITATPSTAPGHARPGLPPQAANGAPPAPLRPAVDPQVVEFIKKFAQEVIKQLESRTKHRAEAIAMSVVNRSLGLAKESTTPEHQQFETIIMAIFEKHKMTFPSQLKKNAATSASLASSAPATTPTASVDAATLARLSSDQLLDVQLVQIVLQFKANMLDIIKPKLGQQRSEALIMSAIDRVLGFTEHTTTHADGDAEKNEFAQAENVMINGLKGKIDEYLRSLPPVRSDASAAVAAVSTGVVSQGQQRPAQPQILPQSQAQAATARGPVGGAPQRSIQSQPHAHVTGVSNGVGQHRPAQLQSQPQPSSQTQQQQQQQQQQRSTQSFLQPQLQAAVKVPAGDLRQRLTHSPAQPPSQLPAQNQTVPASMVGSGHQKCPVPPQQTQPQSQAAVGARPGAAIRTSLNEGQQRPAQLQQQPQAQTASTPLNGAGQQGHAQGQGQGQGQPQAQGAIGAAAGAAPLAGGVQQRPTQPQSKPTTAAAVGETPQRPVQPQALAHSTPQPQSQTTAGSGVGASTEQVQQRPATAAVDTQAQQRPAQPPDQTQPQPPVTNQVDEGQPRPVQPQSQTNP